MSDQASVTVDICNARGLHARASAKFVKLASVRGRESLEACVAHAQDAGRKYIAVASWVLAGEK